MRGKSTSSAQTSVDFLIGISIFAVTLLFVLQIASGSVVNVAPESQTKEAIAERAGIVVYQDYTEGDGDVLEQSYDDIESVLVGGSSLRNRYEVNVTVTNLRTGAVTNTTGAGKVPPDITTAGVSGERRVVDVNGNTSVVDVRVWENVTVDIGAGGPST